MTEERPVIAGAEPATKRVSILSPQALHIRRGEELFYGASQTWYPGFIARMSGCGPTTASNLLWYLAATRPECRGLFDGDGTTFDGMLKLMQSVWHYVTPGMRGVDRSEILSDGALRYGAERGIPLSARVLEVPEIVSAPNSAAERRISHWDFGALRQTSGKERPSAGSVRDFLSGALAADLPIAFLNLSNGGVPNLDSWHWVTLVAVDDKLQAEMLDQGRRHIIDLSLWLEATTKGGALIALEPQNINK